jgi:hypothetical protein
MAVSDARATFADRSCGRALGWGLNSPIAPDGGVFARLAWFGLHARDQSLDDLLAIT